MSLHSVDKVLCIPANGLQTHSNPSEILNHCYSWISSPYSFLKAWSSADDVLSVGSGKFKWWSSLHKIGSRSSILDGWTFSWGHALLADHCEQAVGSTIHSHVRPTAVGSADMDWKPWSREPKSSLSSWKVCVTWSVTPQKLTQYFRRAKFPDQST